MTCSEPVAGTAAKDRPTVIAGVIAVALLVIVVIFAASSSVSEASRRIRCQTTMKQIAAAIATYSAGAGAAKGTLIDTLVQHGLLAKDQVVCPSSGLARPNYVYIPPSARPRQAAGADNTAVVLFEPKANHADRGGNVIFADGHASFLNGADYDEILRTVESLPQVKIGD
ncbi:MAG: hypothetical protein JSU63_20615 [Phycisphaerales bacterium]|nr:MAG: hypothetical protein JSU63_20615 [Phycisphaerales bacterium]